MDRAIERELQEYLRYLPDAELIQVLDYVRALISKGKDGRAGSALVRFAGTIPGSDLGLIEDAIATDCERVDHSEW